MEDIKNAVATEGNKEVENKVNVTESDTPEGAYVHVFPKPFEYEGKTYTKRVFDFEKLSGEYALSPEISTSFLSKLAARAAGVASDVIEHLPAREFGKVKNKSRDFLISTGF